MTDETKVSEVPAPPTQQQIAQQAQATAAMFKEIAQLLKECVFPGSNALRVARALNYLETHADAMVPVAKAEEKRQKKALKLAKQKGIKVVGDKEATSGEAK